ncbi:hypothetical protein Tco_0054406 [Tanacetum coccineum]
MNSSTMFEKLDKAHYGLKQVSKAWYETLSTYLDEHNFVRGDRSNDKAVNESSYKVPKRKSTSADAEDVAATGCCANILWIKSQLTVYDIIYEKIKNHTLKRDIEFYFIPTQYQLADIFIKPLDKPSFKRLIDELAKALENFKVSFSTPTGGIYGEEGVNNFRNAIDAYYLPHSSEYVAPPFIDIVRPWFETIGYGEAVPAKGTLKRVFFLLGGGY